METVEILAGGEFANAVKSLGLTSAVCTYHYQPQPIGVIDETYCGDNDQWYFPARADRHTVIHAGDRICQFRIEKHQPQLFFESVDTLGNADRGGIGSTGKR